MTQSGYLNFLNRGDIFTLGSTVKIFLSKTIHKYNGSLNCVSSQLLLMYYALFINMLFSYDLDVFVFRSVSISTYAS